MVQGNILREMFLERFWNVVVYSCGMLSLERMWTREDDIS